MFEDDSIEPPEIEYEGPGICRDCREDDAGWDGLCVPCRNQREADADADREPVFDVDTAYADRLIQQGLITTDDATDDFEEALIAFEKEHLQALLARCEGFLIKNASDPQFYEEIEPNVKEILDRLVRIFWQRCEGSLQLLRDENAVRQSIARQIIEDGGVVHYPDSVAW